jgi:hypothetical protein
MNRIADIVVSSENLTPAAAVIGVTVVPQRSDAGTEVRGRLMGPRCVYAATVEVGYPLKPLTHRVVIPEPSFWEPESPFLYEGIVELWQDGVRCDQRTIRCGLRTLSLGARGLRLNGRLLPLRGCQPERHPIEVRHLRSQGYNLVVAEPEEALCDEADRFGLFVLARGVSAQDATEVRRVGAHPCFLGWLLSEEAARHGPLPTEGLVGIDLDQPLDAPLPTAARFLVVPNASAAVASLGLPLLVRGEPADSSMSQAIGSITAAL